MSATATCLPGISINVTRSMGGDVIHYSAHADTPNAALALVAALCGRGAPADQDVTAATDKVISDAKKTEVVKPQAAKEADAKKAAAIQTAEVTAKAETATASPSEAAPDYEAVKAKALQLSKEKGRDPLVALLQRHGAAKAPELKEEQYGAFIADVDAILAGTYDPETAELA